MKNLINRYVFDQTTYDSAALISKSTIVHEVKEAGDYRGLVSRNEEFIGEFALSVSERSQDKQVSVDLYSIEVNGGYAEKSYLVTPRGVCVFFVSGGAGGYRVDLVKIGEDREEKVFDSRELTDGDLFVVTLIRPGIYSAVNQKNHSHLEIAVPYPRRVTKRQEFKPVMVDCSAEGIDPQKVEVQAGGGLIFQIRSESKITVELEKPFDRPEVIREPADVPRSLERRVLAVINSTVDSDFLARFLDTGKGSDLNSRLAQRIVTEKKRTGRISGLGQVFGLEKLGPEEFNAVIESLDRAYGKLTSFDLFKKR